jgi:cytoskeletal protein CcmA (bactofilin family)
MNTNIKSILSIFTVAMLALIPVAVQAADLRAGERMNISTEEAITDDVYAAGGQVNSGATIEGDLFTAGGNVVVDGSITEDLQAVGGSVNVLSDVGGDARVGGGDLTVSGSIGEDLVLVSGQAQVSSDEVGGDLVWVGGTLNLSAPVNGDLQLTGKEVYLDSTVDGDVTFKGTQLVLESNATIEGDLSYESPNEVTIKDGATITGETSYEVINKEEVSAVPNFEKFGAFFSTASNILGLLMRLAGALLVGLIFKRFAENASKRSFQRPVVEFARGFAGLVIMPIAGILLAVTLIGLPLGILTFLLYGSVLIVAGFLAPILVGTFVYKSIKQVDGFVVNWLTISLGVLLFALVGYISFVGWIVEFAFTLLALGAVFAMIWHFLKTRRLQ